MLAAISTLTAPPPDAEVEELHAEESLFSAVVEYERLYKQLRLVERQSVRKIMNQIDLAMPAGPSRSEVRTTVMDALAQQRQEIMSWIRGAVDEGATG